LNDQSQRDLPIARQKAPDLAGERTLRPTSDDLTSSWRF
jgi:hypothetical protein